MLDPPYRAWLIPPLSPGGRPGDWLRLASERQRALHGACGLLCGRGLDLSVRIQPRRVHGARACRPDLIGAACCRRTRRTSQRSSTDAYRLYTPHLQDFDAVQRFKRDQNVRIPHVRFLGLWDTVKSYGGIWPQSLPHLRHNPIVEDVRHGLGARRAAILVSSHELGRHRFRSAEWTTLDYADAERCRDLVPRVPLRCRRRLRGRCGGTGIPLRWMLNEAATAGLRLNQAGRDLAASSDPECPACTIRSPAAGCSPNTCLGGSWTTARRHRSASSSAVEPAYAIRRSSPGSRWSGCTRASGPRTTSSPATSRLRSPPRFTSLVTVTRPDHLTHGDSDRSTRKSSRDW